MDLKTLYGLDYCANMTTNGYLLTRRCLERYVALGIAQFQVTLDGYGDDHDVTRRAADGQGTFDVIWQNLLSLRASKARFCVILRVHFLRDGWSAKGRLLERIVAAFGKDDRFRVHVIGVSKFGGPSDELLATASGTEKEDIRQRLLEHVPKRMRQIPGFSCDNYVCYAAKGNSFVVRADGRIAKCTVGLYDDRNVVGSLDSEGKLLIDNHKIRPWFIGFTARDREALSCPANRVLWAG